MGNFCRSGSGAGSTHHPSVGLGFKVHYSSYELNLYKHGYSFVNDNWHNITDSSNMCIIVLMFNKLH